jgi:hypothetical protein
VGVLHFHVFDVDESVAAAAAVAAAVVVVVAAAAAVVAVAAEMEQIPDTYYLNGH